MNSQFISMMRPEQRQAFEAMKNVIDNNKNLDICYHITGATGSGKTHSMLLSLASLAKAGRTIIVQSPNVEVLTELHEKFKDLIHDVKNEYNISYSKEKGQQNTKEWIDRQASRMNPYKKNVLFVTMQSLNIYCDGVGRTVANKFFKETLKVDLMFGDEAHRWGIVIGNELLDRGYDFNKGRKDEFEAAWLRTVLVAFDGIPKFAATATMTNSQISKKIKFNYKQEKYVFKNSILFNLTVAEENKMPMLISATHGEYMSPQISENVSAEQYYNMAVKYEQMHCIENSVKQVVEATCKTINEYAKLREDMIRDCPELLTAAYAAPELFPRPKAIISFKNREEAEFIKAMEGVANEHGIKVAYSMPSSEGIDHDNELEDFRDTHSEFDILFTKTLANEGINILHLICVGIAKSNNIKNEVEGSVLQLIGRILRAYFPFGLKDLQKKLKRKLTKKELWYYYLFSSPVVHSVNSKTNSNGIERASMADTFSKQNNAIIRLDTPILGLSNHEYYAEFQEVRDKMIDNFMEKYSYREANNREDMRDIVLEKMSRCPFTHQEDTTVLDIAHIVPHADIQNYGLGFDESNPSLYIALRTDVHRRFDDGQFYFNFVNNYVLETKLSPNITDKQKAEAETAGIVEGTQINIPHGVIREAIEYRKNMVLGNG